MKENITENANLNKNTELDISRIFRAVWKRAWIVALSTVLCVVLAVLFTFYLITPKYQSSTLFYVNNSTFSVGDASLSITSGDITAAKSLVDTYIVILNSRACLNDVLDYADSELDYEQLRNMLAASSVNETEVFQVVVTSPDPAEAERLANAIAHILPKRISSIVEGTTASVVDYAVQAAKPSSPSYVKNSLIAFLAGFLFSVAVLAVREIFDVTIRSEEDVHQCCTHPILASVPDMYASSRGGYYYKSGKYGKYAKYSKYAYSKKAYAASSSAKNGAKVEQSVALIGKSINFSAFEAYKLLRTKLQFSFTDEISCPVIGVTSALAGEGKSLSSVNLAYSLSQLDKKVLLIDCDLRRPSLSVKLPIKKSPGLSDFLTGHATLEEVSQACRVDDEGKFVAIASGHNPPNPIELLSSAKMEKLVAQLREFFDYIILDLPPVDEVSDAMVAAKFADGILLVVRQDYCSTTALSGAVNQFEFIESRILGIVMNCVVEGGFGYRYYGKKYYGYKYSRKYRYAYAARESAPPQSASESAPTQKQ